MASEEVSAFLARKLDAVIGLNRREGGPQLSVVWFAWDGEQFLLSFPNGSAKHNNLKRDPHVTLLINNPSMLQYVTAYGRVELTEPITFEHRFQIMKKYTPADQHEAWIKRAPTEDQIGVVLRPARLLTYGFPSA